eukprot:TRINITY_DN31234_c0_g2_i1.p1 TRINITY_DN31234_c0_g2~~TRINITY_DN31234_c0_g2_i1.p1  ORF type:complete len:1554 (+),score=238.42 TRINITY_DN31234_c0_g2_i1:672-4664(+)
MTRRLHDLYFERGTFYRLQQDPDHAILDADVRICRDARDLANTAAELAVTLTEASIKASVCGLALLACRPGDFVWFCSAPVFFIAAVKAILGAEPTEGSSILASLQRAESSLRRKLANVSNHAASICALQGELFELDVLLKAVRDLCSWAKRRHDVMFLMETAEWIWLQSPQALTFMELAAFLGATTLGARDTGHSSDRLGRLFRDVHCFLNCLSCSPVFLGARARMLHCAYLANRVRQLFDCLEKLQPVSKDKRRRRSKGNESEMTEDSSNFSVRNCGPVVALEGVSLYTPSRQVMFHSVTFALHERESLIICGHERAGKTSIARCLMRFFPQGTGRICRPLDEREVCYMPPVPHCPPGSLSEQLTYPFSTRKGLPEPELRRWLNHVGLEGLVDLELAVKRRKIASDELAMFSDGTLDWQTILSKAELQALGMARLLYHRPQFAVLDECTTALDETFEGALLEAARTLGIACLTVTRDSACTSSVARGHGRMLRLIGCSGGEPGGWRLTDITPRVSKHRASAVTVRVVRRPNVSTPSGSSSPGGKANPHEEVAAVLSRHDCLARTRVVSPHASVLPHRQRTPPRPGWATSSVAAAEVRMRWPSRWLRFAALGRLALKNFTRRKIAMRRGFAIVVCLCLRTRLSWLSCQALVGMVRASLVRDPLMIVSEAVVGGIVVLVGGLFDQLMKHQIAHLMTEMWAGAMVDLQRRVLRNLASLRAATVPSDASGLTLVGRRVVAASVEDPVARLYEVRGVFDALGLQLGDMLLSVSNLVYVGPELVRALGVPTALLSLVTSWLLVRVARLSVAIAPSRVGEGSRRFFSLHKRIRLGAEAMALGSNSSGADADRGEVEDALNSAITEACSARWRELPHRIFASLIAGNLQLPAMAQRILVFRFAQRAGIAAASCAIPLEDSLAALFLFDRMAQMLQVALQQLARSSVKLDRVDAQCSRCLELVVGCEMVSEVHDATAGTCANADVGDSGESCSIAIHGLDLETPRGMSLARGLTLTVQAGVPLAVLGPSGSGKTVLCEALLGLGSLATVARRPPLKTIFAANERAYLPPGRLVMQLLYPKVLKLPSRPPFQLTVQDVPVEVDDDAVRAHFVDELGASAVVSVAGTRRHVVTFATADDLLTALARPNDRTVYGRTLHCELGGDIAGVAGVSPSQAFSPPSFVRLRRALQAVGLEHILAREPDGWFAKRSWEDVLSGEEQQLLCFARVLYHGPVFGLFDDCVTMLPKEAVENLYRRAFEDWGITPIVCGRRRSALSSDTVGVRLGVATSAPGWEPLGAVAPMNSSGEATRVDVAVAVDSDATSTQPSATGSTEVVRVPA